MTYRVEVRTGVSDYLRSLEAFTREGRLALYGFMNALRDYGDEARQGCPRQTPESTVFCLRWTFDAGPAIRSLDLYVDDSQGAVGLLEVLYADLVPLPGENLT
jgi:hypothetical protein